MLTKNRKTANLSAPQSGGTVSLFHILITVFICCAIFLVHVVLSGVEDPATVKRAGARIVQIYKDSLDADALRAAIELGSGVGGQESIVILGDVLKLAIDGQTGILPSVVAYGNESYVYQAIWTTYASGIGEVVNLRKNLRPWLQKAQDGEGYANAGKLICFAIGHRPFHMLDAPLSHMETEELAKFRQQYKTRYSGF